MGALTKEATKSSPAGSNLTEDVTQCRLMVRRKSSDFDASALYSCISLHLVEEHFFYLCFAEKGGTQALQAKQGTPSRLSSSE